MTHGVKFYPTKHVHYDHLRKTSTMATEQQQLSFSENTVEQIAEDPAGLEPVSFRMSFLIDAAATIAKRHKPWLGLGEWMTLIDTNRDYQIIAEASARTIISKAWDNVRHANEEIQKKWGVDCKALSRKMQALSFDQQFATYELIRHFITRKDKKATGLEHALQKAGANVILTQSEAMVILEDLYNDAEPSYMTNDIARAELNEWIARVAKYPLEENINIWQLRAEQIARNLDAIVEIAMPADRTISGEEEKLILSREGFSWML